MTGRIYEKFMRYTVTGGYIKKFIVFSAHEPKYYASLFRVPEELFKAEILGVNDHRYLYPHISTENFFVSAGRSNRDYDFLRKCWSKNEDRIEIICDTEKNGSHDNIVYLNNCHGQEYIMKLAKYYAVIIPLKDKNISPGQLVIINSMMMGKPVIVTENSAVTNYVEHGVNGLIIEKTEQALTAALAQLKQKDYYSMLSENAKKTFPEKFDLRAMGQRIGSYL